MSKAESRGIKLYSQFIDARIAEKHKPKAERDNVLIEGYKLLLNGTYGKSNENTSFMYDPLYTFKTTIEVVRNQLNSFYDSLTGLEEKITNLNFEEILTNVEVKVNNAKDGLCESFESAHADEIASINARIAARKEALEGKSE